MQQNLHEMPQKFIPNAVGVKQYSIIQFANPTYRQYMEDTSMIIDCFLPNCPKSTLFGVFDGHGGAAISKKLPGLVSNIVKYATGATKSKIQSPNTKKSVTKSYGNDYKTILIKSFEQANQTLLENYDGQSGSTGTVGLILLEQSKRILYLAYVGDSSAYIFSDHQAQTLTKQHRANNLQQKKRVQNSGGKILQNRLCGVLAVTRAFGDFSLRKMGLIATPDVIKIQIRLQHKFLIVASDGLWDFLPIQKILNTVRQQTEADSLSRRLMKLAIQNGSNDNITIMVLKLN